MKKYAKIAALLMAFVLVIAGTVGVTMALLTAKTGSITNTFTVGNVEIDLTETTGNTYKIVPGKDIAKNPTVIVKQGSEDCWLFVNLAGLAAFNGAVAEEKITYTLDGWTLLEGDVYYRSVTAAEVKDANKSFAVFTDNTINVEESLTKTDLENLTGKTIVVTAYAVQTADSITTAAEAWNAVKNL